MKKPFIILYNFYKIKTKLKKKKKNIRPHQKGTLIVQMELDYHQ